MGVYGIGRWEYLIIGGVCDSSRPDAAALLLVSGPDISGRAAVELE
jgi:hypothetical protein